MYLTLSHKNRILGTGYSKACDLPIIPVPYPIPPRSGTGDECVFLPSFNV